MYISYFTGVLVTLVWFLPRWVRCYELLYVHISYVLSNRVANWVWWDYRRDVVNIWDMGNPLVVL
jgi:hypothetical protein